IIGTVFWLIKLPGSPSQYSFSFPVAQGALPENAKYDGTGAVGFDLYTNHKALPELRKEDILPARKTSTWGTSSQHNGKYILAETLWIEHDRQLYEIGHFGKEYETQPNRNMSMTKVLSVNQSRQITERIIIPDLDIDETFGPFPLP
ncbi:MAG: hypothetical protein ABIJ53_06160, partial [Verrucomicrobiota bacterium]